MVPAARPVSEHERVRCRLFPLPFFGAFQGGFCFIPLRDTYRFGDAGCRRRVVRSAVRRRRRSVPRPGGAGDTGARVPHFQVTTEIYRRGGSECSDGVRQRGEGGLSELYDAAQLGRSEEGGAEARERAGRPRRAVCKAVFWYVCTSCGHPATMGGRAAQRVTPSP